MILQRSKLLTLKLLPLIAALLQVVLLPPKSFVVQAQAGDFPAFIDSTELKTAIALWVDNRTLAVRQFGNISDWDVSKIEDFSRAFQNLNLVTAFDEDLSSWNTSSALDMTAMFMGAVAFSGDLSAWDTSKVTSFADMFRGASSFNSDISKWQTSEGRDFSTMFWGATSFNIDLSDWNVMNGRDFSGMFRDATSFSQALCWQFRETVIVTAMFCESGGSFRKDCICEFDYYYDKTCTHPNLVPLVECSPPEPENAAFVAFSGISLALAGLVSSWFILL